MATASVVTAASCAVLTLHCGLFAACHDLSSMPSRGLTFYWLRLNTNFSASRDVGHLMIDLECKESPESLRVVCDFLLAPSAVASGKLTLH